MKKLSRLCRLSVVLLFCVSAVLLARPGATGLIHLSEEEQSAILAEFKEYSPASPRGELPASVFNFEHLPKIGDQGSLGICGSFCVYYYLSSYCHHQTRGMTGRPDVNASAEWIFSPAWGVLTAPHEGAERPIGASSLKSIQTIVNQGTLTWAQMPYDNEYFFQRYPDTELLTAAMTYRASYGLTISGCNTPEGLKKLKQFLAEKNIAVVTWNEPLTTNFDSYPHASEYVEVNGQDIGNVNNNVYAWPSEAHGRPDGHALTLVGYDDNKTYTNKEGESCKGAFLLANSWGEDWGISPAPGVEGGFIWVSYETFLKYGKIYSQVWSMAFPREPRTDLLCGTLRIQDFTGNGQALRWG